MKWLVCKAEYKFNEEQNCSMYHPIECIQVFNTEEEANEAYCLFQSINYEFTYVIFNSEEIK